MSNDTVEGQMPLFETSIKVEKEPAPPAATPIAKASRTVAKRDAGNAKAKDKPEIIKSKQKSRSKKKGAEQARSTSGQVPEGDVRLTANIREDLHLKLKIAAAQKRTTIGELIEMLVAKHLK